MPLPVAGLRFGMGLDDQSRVRVILPRPSQHLGEAVGIRLPQPDRGVSARLVDDQHEARIGRVERRIDGAVLAQMRLRHARDDIACAVEKGRVVKGMVREQGLEIRRPRGVENACPSGR